LVIAAGIATQISAGGEDRLAANALLELVRRGLESLLTIRAAADRDQGGSSEVPNKINF
jgi:hypothetical protein